jgi:AAHS family 4-hydroxybenzoate transporter-like MFS transporter
MAVVYWEDFMSSSASLSVDVTRAIDSAPLGRFQIAIFALCAAVAVIDGFDTQAIAFVAPAIIEEWKMSPAVFGAVFAIGLAGLATGAFVLGPLADRYGRRRLLLACSLIFGVFALLTAWCETFNQLLVLRFLTGIGLGGAMPGIIALTSEYAPARARATSITIMFCGFPLGAFLGGFLAAYLIPTFGWRSVFVVGGCIPLLFSVVLWFTVPESIRFLAKSGSRGAEITKLLNRIVPNAPYRADQLFSLPEQNLSSFPVSHLFTEGRAKMTLLVWTAFFANLMVMYFLFNWMPTLFKQEGLPIATAIKSTAVMNLGGVVGAIVLGRLIDRAGALRTLSLAYVGAAVFLAMIVAIDRSNAVLLLPAVFMAGFGIAGAQIGMNALTAEVYPTEMRSTGVGWALGIGRVGAIIGPIVGGALLALEWSPTLILSLTIMPMLVAAMAVFGLGFCSLRGAEAQAAV